MNRYESEWATLYCGDSAEALDLIEKRSVGLIATDPPYGVKYVSNIRKEAFAPIVGDDGTLDVPALLGAYVRKVLVPDRHVYAFGFRAEQLKDACLFGGHSDLVWDKGQVGMGDLTLPWGTQHEPIAFGTYVPSKRGRDRGSGNLSARMRKGNVLRVQRKNGTGNKRHPTEKPVALMSMLVESSSVLGDVVCDPFTGVGSTAVASILLGRKFVGAEIDPRYFDTAVERIKAAEKIREAMEGA